MKSLRQLTRSRYIRRILSAFTTISLDGAEGAVEPNSSISRDNLRNFISSEFVEDTNENRSSRVDATTGVPRE